MAENLIEHLESLLGPITEGWLTDAEGRRQPFQIVMFKGGPIQNILTLATLGLSKVHLKLRKSGKLIRQELVFLLRDTAGTRNLPGVLQELVHEILQRGESL